MERLSVSNLPFRCDRYPIAESSNSCVFGFGEVPVVVKVQKNESGSYPCVGAAKDAVRNAIKDRQKLAQALSSKTVVPEGYVFHSNTSGGVDVIRCQDKVEGRSLSEVSLSHLSPNSLRELSLIFQCNLSEWRARRAVHDLVGSTNKNINLLQKIMRSLLPFRSSENIMVDQNNEIKVVDTSILHYGDANVRSKIKIYVQLLGTHLSLFVINSLINLQNEMSEAEGIRTLGLFRDREAR